MPLESIHDNAREAAQFSEAAARQGQYLEYSDLLYDGQSDWAGEADPTSIFEGYANELSLNQTRLANDLADPEINAGITADAQGAIAIGINSTPTFVLQGERQQGLPTNQTGFDELATRIQAEIDAVDAVFRINSETGDLSIADTDRFASATFPMTIPILVKDSDGNEEVIEVDVSRAALGDVVPVS